MTSQSGNLHRSSTRLQSQSRRGRSQQVGRTGAAHVERLEGRSLFSGVAVGSEVIGTVTVDQATTLSAAVYDAHGQIVRTLLQAAPETGGRVNLLWDGRDDYGHLLPAGDYQWRAISGQPVASDDGQVGDGSDMPFGEAEQSNYVAAVAVDSAGNVYENSYYEEGHNDLRKWNALGEPVWGINVEGGGLAVAVDADYIYFARDMGGKCRVERRSAADGAAAPWGESAFLAQTDSIQCLLGLAVDGQHLWVSNAAENRVEIYDKSTGASLGSFPLDHPRGLAAAGDGSIWVAYNGDRVGKFASDGTQLAEVTGLNDPYAVAVGGADSHLYVGEVGSGKVREFQCEEGVSQVRELFGAAQPGPVSDDAFYWPTTKRAALAVDAAGQMVVADPGNHRVLTYSPDAKVLRTHYSEFQPAPFTDPSVDPGMLLSGPMQYEVNYTPGENYGTWHVTDNWRPADDQWWSDSAVRRRLPNGKDYLFYFHANRNPSPGVWLDRSVAVYALEPTGMRRSAIIGSEYRDDGGPNRLWNWTDSDGDGQVEDSETTSLPEAPPRKLDLAVSWSADDEGNLWIGNWGNATAEMPMRGFDSLGNPLYDWAAAPPKVVAAPDTTPLAFQPSGVKIQPATGEIYRVGTTAENRDVSGFWNGGGTAVERLNPDGSRISVLPITPKGAINDLVTIATGTDPAYFYTGHSGGDQHWVKMYTADGLLVTTAHMGPNNGGSGGWMDHDMALTAFTDPQSGVHYSYAEDVYYGKSIRYRFDGLDTLARSKHTFTWSHDAFQVTNTNDSGEGSLRQSIIYANEHPGRDTIGFAIPGDGVHTISPLSPLPAITDTVTLDGTTEPGYAGTPVIELSGAQAGKDSVTGLQVVGHSGSSIVGLAINRFSGQGLYVENRGGMVIADNRIGISVDGATAQGNGASGILIQGNPADADGAAVLVRNNLISGNAVHGVFIEDSSSVWLQGNRIGTDAAGLAALPNGLSGVSLNVAPRNLIGGTAPGAGNLISGNGAYAISIGGDRSVGNRIEGNLIGTDATGSAPLGSIRRGGIIIGDASGNTIGGIESGAGNTIAYNAGAGIAILSGRGNSVLSNSLFSNAWNAPASAVDLSANGVTANDIGDGDSGPNDLQNYPVLSWAVSGDKGTRVRGTLNSGPNKTFRLEFFAGDGQGDGKDLIGTSTVQTDAAGNAAFDLNFATPVQLQRFVTATATDSEGNTSELSPGAPVAARETAPPWYLTANVPAEGITYGDASAVVTGRISDGVFVPIGSVKVTLEGVAQNVAIGKDGSFSATFDTHALGAGDRVVTVMYGENTERQSVSTTLHVAPKQLTVKVADATRAYGESNPAFAVEYAEFINGDSQAALTGTLHFATAASAASDVGTYDVTASRVSGANYTITFLQGKLSVTKARAILSVRGYSGTYDGAAHGAMAVTTGALNEDLGRLLSFTYADAQTGAAVSGQPTQIGRYIVTAHFAGNENYESAEDKLAVVEIKATALSAAAALTVNGTEGSWMSGVVVASFTDNSPNAKASDFGPVMIDWGDGSEKSVGTIVANAQGGFNVVGTHTFKRFGNYQISASVQDLAGRSTPLTLTGTAKVADATLHVLAPTPVTGSQGKTAGALLSFTDDNLFSKVGDFTVTINWGDNTSSSGYVMADPNHPGTFAVIGSHAYATGKIKSYNATVTVGDGGDSKLVAPVTINL
jgi:hypothetical protein